MIRDGFSATERQRERDADGVVVMNERIQNNVVITVIYYNSFVFIKKSNIRTREANQNSELYSRHSKSPTFRWHLEVNRITILNTQYKYYKDQGIHSLTIDDCGKMEAKENEMID